MDIAEGEAGTERSPGRDFAGHKTVASDGLLLLLGEDRERASAFVEREIGPLIRTLGPRAERLLGTLQAYLEHGQRIANTTAATGLHRDTVHCHLREVEALLGYRLEERSAELLWALRLRRDTNALSAAAG